MALDKEKSSPQATVLVMTDDNEDGDSLTRFLVRHDMTVLRAYNGPECLEIVRTHTVDVVLLDVKMPGMDEPALLAVCAELKQISPALPFILVNGDDWATWTARALACARAAGVKSIGVNLPGDTSMKLSDHAGILARTQAQLRVRRWEQELNPASATIKPTKPPTTE
jgi:CheY-like chemotaxis protein